MKHQIKNIILDCNGTMIFDGKYHDIAWKSYAYKLANRHLTTEEFQQHVLGHTNRDILEWLPGKETLSDEFIMRLTEQKEREYRSMFQADTNSCRLVDGLERCLDTWKKQKIALNIATGSNQSNIDFYFDKFSLSNWFDKQAIAFDDGTMQAKPAPDMYLRAMKNMGAKPEETMVFEDSPSGVRAAAAAGAAVVVGIYGDSDRKLLEDTGLCDFLIHDYCAEDLYSV